MNKVRILAMFAILGLLLLVAVPSQAQTSPITVPIDLLPGDQYRLAFVTTGMTGGTSADPAFYNNFVTDDAAVRPELLALGTTWTAIASIGTVNAVDNTATNPAVAVGVPIYTLNGVRIADNYADLWDGSISSPLNINRDGVGVGFQEPYSGPWGGSFVSGTSCCDFSLGTGSRNSVAYAAYTDERWITGPLVYNFTGHALYGLSGILTIANPIPPFAGTAELVIYNGDEELPGGGSENARLECQGGQGHLNTGNTITLPATCRAESYSVSGPWINLAEGNLPVNAELVYDGGWQLQVEFATVTLNLHNNNVTIPAGGAEDARLEFQGGIGHHGSAAVLHLPPEATITYRPESYSVSGPWATTTFVAGDSTFGVEYAAATLNLHNNNVTIPAGDPENARLEFQGGIGHHGSGAVLHLPSGASITYRAESYSVSGPWVITTFAAGDSTFGVEYATVTLNLHNNNVTIPAGDPENARLEFQGGIGHHGSGAVLHLPTGASITYRAESYSVSGPWATTTFTAGDSTFGVEYATVTLNLHNNNVTIPAGGAEDARLEFQGGMGHHGSGAVLHVPSGASITYRLESYSVSGPWATTTFAAGDSTFAAEYATVMLFLHNNNVELAPGTPENVRLEFQGGMGHHGSGDVLHLPPGVTITYRQEAYSLSGPWATETFSAGDTTWPIEYATVTILVDLPPAMAVQILTEVQGGVGNVAHGATIHVPADSTLTMRAKNGAWATGWFNVPVLAGDGTVTWGIGPTYTQ